MQNPTRIHPLFLKLFLIGVLTLLLLVPLLRVEALIAERSLKRADALARVANVVGHAQQIGAVLLNVPVSRSWIVDGKAYAETREYRLLARTVNIGAVVETGERRSGIYTVPAFQAKLTIGGVLATDALQEALAPEPGVTKRIGTPQLVVAISDPAGIRAFDGIRVNGRSLRVQAASAGDLRGVGANLAAVDVDQAQDLEFSFELQVSGTERLQFLPLAETTKVDMNSSWPSPSFSGAYGPQPAANVTNRGFAAGWQVLQVNRDYPQLWTGEAVTAGQIARSAFGVDFYQPVDTYQRNYRAIHYAFLFIALTFMVLYLTEVVLGRPLHPVQYGMTGAALAVFYLVLLALSEHLAFGGAYAAAGGALALLLAVYYSGALHSVRAGAVTGAVSGASFALLYLLILSEDYALLFGALSIFGVLAAIMIATRKLDWYRLGAGT